MKEKLPNKLGAALRWTDRKSGLLTTRKHPWATYLLAFFLPVVLLALTWVVQGVWPFGDRMILAHDQWHQYYPFFVDFRARLRSGHSLFYSWNTGMGTNYLTLYAYYLASPLNWLALLVPDSLVLPYYTAMTLVKIGCAGLFFLIFLHKTFERCEPVQAFFSTMYALCAFIMGYYWNAIWLDTVALLPLVALGTLRLLRDRKYVLYVFSLALAVLCSYYIGLFVCFFVLLVFICYNIVNWDDLGGFWSRFWRIAFFSALALGITAVVTVPAMIGLLNTASAKTQFPKGFTLNITKKTGLAGVLDALRLIAGNGAVFATPTSFNETLPNVYCGVSALVLALGYLLCRRISLRERLCCAALLLLLALSFAVKQLDYVWHGFHVPNMLPFRYSFLFSFLVLFMAYRAYTQLDRLRWYDPLLLLPAIGIFVYCVVSSQGLVQVLLTALLLLVCLGGLLGFGRKLVSKNLLTLVLCACLLLEAILSAVSGANAIGSTNRSSYPKLETDTRAVVEKMLAAEQDNPDRWRAEFTQRQTLNDSALFSFPGVSVFSSACNSNVSAFLESLGLGAKTTANRYSYEQSDPAVNLLLGIKYLIDRDGWNADPEHFRRTVGSGEVQLYRNKDYLPMGWVVSTQTLGYDPAMSGTPFDRIEALYGGMMGSNLKLYERVLPSQVTYEGEASGPEGRSTSYTFRSDGDDDSRMSICFTMERDGQLSLYTKSWNAGNAYLYVNGEYRCYYSDKYGALRFVGALQAGDEVMLRYRVKDAQSSATVHINAAMLDEAAFGTVHDTLAAQTLRATAGTDTALEGTVTAQEDALLFTSIPYDSGWKAYVDGVPVRVQPVAGTFVCLRVPAGAHEIRLNYETPGYSVGLLISAVSLGLYLIAVVLSLVLRLSSRPMAKVDVQMTGMPAKAPEPDPTDLPDVQPPMADDRTIAFRPPQEPAEGGAMPELVREPADEAPEDAAVSGEDAGTGEERTEP